ncbi:dihydropteroate synthase [Achromatium sp. WMS3]|nr:dihydropteroate synthase [Achromatium sp. WMS3]
MTNNAVLDCAGKPLDLTQPQVMGILNITPDSFSDGGHFMNIEMAITHAQRMVAEGAAIIDIGGESTRPGAKAVAVSEELTRVIPVIQALATKLNIPISIDTSKPEVMEAAVAAGAGFINDTMALQQPGALEVATKTKVPISLMHMQGEPRTMQVNPNYQDIVAEVTAFFEARIEACEAVGIPHNRILIDPGFGFGKTLEHNITLFQNLDKLQRLEQPILIGISRKSMFGSLLNRPITERLPGSIAATVLALQAGVKLLRVHDVAATVDALRVVKKLSRLEEGIGSA